MLPCCVLLVIVGAFLLGFVGVPFQSYASFCQCPLAMLHWCLVMPPYCVLLIFIDVFLYVLLVFVHVPLLRWYVPLCCILLVLFNAPFLCSIGVH